MFSPVPSSFPQPLEPSPPFKRRSHEEIMRAPHGALLAQGDCDAAYAAARDPARWDLVVFCARELKPPALVRGAGVATLYAPNVDLPQADEARLSIAWNAAREVASALYKGKRVLVTCAAGRNRSGLVSAMALHLYLGIDGRTAADVVRAMRRGADGPALTNDAFNAALARLPARQRAAVAVQRASSPRR